MTNENSDIQFFPVNSTGSQTENRPAFGRKNINRCQFHMIAHIENVEQYASLAT
jgi:hypothetical protein